MLPRRNRLSSTEFERAFNKSQVVRHPLVQVRAHRRDDEGADEVRAAFVVPKKQGKAHDRNRTKRRLRERFRLHPRRDQANLRGCDLIFLTTPTTHTASVPELDAALDEVLRRLGKRMSEGDNSPKRPEERPQKSEHSESEQDTLSGVPFGAQSAPDFRRRSEVGFSRTAPTLVERTEGSASVSESEPVSEPEPEPDSQKAPVRFKSAPVAWVFIVLIRFYQNAISPSLPPSCRFFPTCSAYTVTAIERHGAFWGTLLGAWRICRCTPLCKGGFDPVPDHLHPRFSSPFLGLLTKNKSPKTG